MSYFYTILYIAIISSSLFAMDKKSSSDNKYLKDNYYDASKTVKTSVTNDNKAIERNYVSPKGVKTTIYSEKR